jgi:hypothetical protein
MLKRGRLDDGREDWNVECHIVHSGEDGVAVNKKGV